MVTKEEQLDELLAMAREVGRLGNELAKAEHDAEYNVRSWRGKNGRYFVRQLRKELATAQASLEAARKRFLDRQ